MHPVDSVEAALVYDGLSLGHEANPRVLAELIPPDLGQTALKCIPNYQRNRKSGSHRIIKIYRQIGIFNSEEGLESHLATAKAHTYCYPCDPCNEVFNSEEALENHLSTSNTHNWCYLYNSYNQVFDSEVALKSHLFTSKAHTFCYTCNRGFISAGALQSHRRNAVSKFLGDEAQLRLFYPCNTCNEGCNTKKALETTYQPPMLTPGATRTTHAMRFSISKKRLKTTYPKAHWCYTCDPCSEVFNSEEAL